MLGNHQCARPKAIGEDNGFPVFGLGFAKYNLLFVARSLRRLLIPVNTPRFRRIKVIRYILARVKLCFKIFGGGFAKAAVRLFRFGLAHIIFSFWRGIAGHHRQFFDPLPAKLAGALLQWDSR